MASRQVRPRAQRQVCCQRPSVSCLLCRWYIMCYFLLEKSKGIYTLVGTRMEKSECGFCSEGLMCGPSFHPPVTGIGPACWPGLCTPSALPRGNQRGNQSFLIAHGDGFSVG